MSPCLELRLPPTERQRLTAAATDAPQRVRTLAEAERAHILETLRQVNWVIAGRNGAASRLGLPRTTLIYRMRKLGIKADKIETFANAVAEPSQGLSPGVSTRGPFVPQGAFSAPSANAGSELL